MSVLEGSGHNRELTRECKLHPATVASRQLQNAILGPQSAEFNDYCCYQANALIENWDAAPKIGLENTRGSNSITRPDLAMADRAVEVTRSGKGGKR